RRSRTAGRGCRAAHGRVQDRSHPPGAGGAATASGPRLVEQSPRARAPVAEDEGLAEDTKGSTRPAPDSQGRGRHPGLRSGRCMTLDSSALIAVLFAEPGYLDLVDRILETGHVRIGAPTLVEA